MFNVVVLDCHYLNDERISRHVSSLLPENYVIRLNYSGDADISKWTNINNTIPTYTYPSKKMVRTDTGFNMVYYFKGGINLLKKMMSILLSHKSIRYVRSHLNKDITNIIIHVHDPLLLPLSLRLKHKFPSAKIVYDRHEFYDRYKRTTSIISQFVQNVNNICEKIAKKKVDGLVFVVPGYEKELQLLFPNSKITVVPNYIDFQLVDDDKTRDKINKIKQNSPIKCVYFGTINRTSRECELITYLAKETLPKYNYLEFVVGGRTNDELLLHEFTSLEKLHHNKFKYVGFIPYADMIKETQSAAIGFYFQKPTGNYCVGSSPNKFYEYLKCATIPFVRYNVDCSFMKPEAVVCESDDTWEDILCKFEKLITEPRTRLEERMQFLFNKSNQYSFKNIAHNYTDLYRDILINI